MFLCCLLLLYCLLENGGTEKGEKAQMRVKEFSLFILCSNHTFCTLDEYQQKVYGIFPTLHAKEQWKPQCLAKGSAFFLGRSIFLYSVPLSNSYFFSYQVSRFQEHYKQFARHDIFGSFFARVPKKDQGSPVLESSNTFVYCNMVFR